MFFGFSRPAGNFSQFAEKVRNPPREPQVACQWHSFSISSSQHE